MFAVIRTGGRQYKVAKDDKVAVEKLTGDLGSVIKLDEVLMIGEIGKPPTVGVPVIEKAGVFAEVIGQTKAKKVIVFKKKRRKNYRRMKGHRQEQTLLKILEVSASGTQTKKVAVKKAVTKKASSKETSTQKVLEKGTKESKAAPTKKTEVKQQPKLRVSSKEEKKKENKSLVTEKSSVETKAVGVKKKKD